MLNILERLESEDLRKRSSSESSQILWAVKWTQLSKCRKFKMECKNRTCGRWCPKTIGFFQKIDGLLLEEAFDQSLWSDMWNQSYDMNFSRLEWMCIHQVRVKLLACSSGEVADPKPHSLLLTCLSHSETSSAIPVRSRWWGKVHD